MQIVLAQPGKSDQLLAGYDDYGAGLVGSRALETEICQLRVQCFVQGGYLGL